MSSWIAKNFASFGGDNLWDEGTRRLFLISICYFEWDQENCVTL